MLIARDHVRLPQAFKGGVVLIGNFDGVHRGHAALIAEAKRRAAGHPVVVLTFEPHPRRFFAKDGAHVRLLPFHLKARLLAAQGVSAMLAQRFNAAFATLSADAFMQTVLADALEARAVITGADFCFGKGRSGNAQMLAEASQKLGFEYVAIDPIAGGTNGEKIGSRAIRAAIAQGGLEEAARLLGRPYGWMGSVIGGEKRGRTLGFPTANIAPPPGVVAAPHGVYAVRAWDASTVQAMDGVANWGVRPSFGGGRPLLEVHLMGRDVDLYGKRLYVEWIAPIRPEQRFESKEALCNQIAQDCREASRLLAVYPAADWPFSAG